MPKSMEQNFLLANPPDLHDCSWCQMLKMEGIDQDQRAPKRDRTQGYHHSLIQVIPTNAS